MLSPGTRFKWHMRGELSSGPASVRSRPNQSPVPDSLSQRDPDESAAARGGGVAGRPGKHPPMPEAQRLPAGTSHGLPSEGGEIGPLKSISDGKSKTRGRNDDQLRRSS